tara:strand:- start:44 stop:289 length:246 start_codon:yes stop_codon:yes gene_type:complete
MAKLFYVLALLLAILCVVSLANYTAIVLYNVDLLMFLKLTKEDYGFLSSIIPMISVIILTGIFAFLKKHKPVKSQEKLTEE